VFTPAAVYGKGNIVLFPRRKFNFGKKLAQKAEPLPLPPFIDMTFPRQRFSLEIKFARKKGLIL
ncbi:MAG: hypothetical protein K2J11_09360, partial [Oscillospiraceae bacterium]|nr:hypothetical protein [Oscillospiraceae bacterium]